MAATTAIAGAITAVSLAVLIPVAYAQTPLPAPADATSTPPASAPAATPDGGATPSLDEMEADVLGGKNAPATAPPPAAPPALSPAAPPPARHARLRMVSADEQQAPAADGRPGFVIELETAGFVSGALTGGVFLGARLSPDVGNLIVGGSLDFASTSTSTTTPVSAGSMTVTTSSSSFALGAGVRYTLVSANDGRLDLFGAGDVGFVHAGTSMLGTSASASGFTVAAGPGLRLWVTDHVAVGYLARFRLTQLAGSDGNGDATTAGFAGTFQILAVF
jgi:hypothetical protein